MLVALLSACALMQGNRLGARTKQGNRLGALMPTTPSSSASFNTYTVQLALTIQAT